uniref:Uncharacterized protein n=1 Tax=Kalanchoe fedtschenkoi TaxID=63787 RepID=A0A7N1A9V8_KALFE
MGDSEKLMALKKAYADIILNTAKEAAARVMAAERRAFRFQRQLADSKEEALRVMVRLKHMMDSKIYEADVMASRQQSKIEELEAQLHEAEDIVKDLREELSFVRDELDDVKRNRSRRMDEQQPCHLVIQGREEQGEGIAPSVSYGIQVSNSQMGHVETLELRSLSNHRTSESLGDDHHEILHVGSFDLAPHSALTKEPEFNRSESTEKIHALKNEELSNIGGLQEKDQTVKSYSAVQENGEDSGNCVIPTQSAKFCVSGRKSNARMKKDEKNVSNIYPAMKRRAHDVRFKKTTTLSSWKRRQSLAKKVLKSLKESNFVASKTSPTSVIVHSEEMSSAVRESGGQKLGPSCNTDELCSNTGLNGSIQACRIQSTPVNVNSNMSKASAGEENGSAESSVTCADMEIARAPSCAALEDSDALVSDEASQPKNDQSVVLTFQRKRKKESMCSADENDIVEVVKRSSEGETGVRPSNIVSNGADFFRRSSQQSDDKEDTLQEFKRSLKRMNVEKPTETKPKAISIVPRASQDSRRLAQVAHQLLSMSEKKWWD